MTAKERVQQESVELDERISKLVDFMILDKLDDLSEEMKFLLSMQLDAMASYVDILNRRLEIWQD